MRKEINTHINIAASPQKIWTILMAFENYPEWNPFIRQIKGEPFEGKTMEVIISPPGGSNMKFTPLIIAHQPENEFVWKGRLLINGLFDGKHTFRLQANEDGTTTFIHQEEFSGVLVGLFNLKNTERGFHLMNQQLKRLAERA